MAEAVTASQYREVQGEVWGTYVAAVEININGARAFNVGDPVPTSHVQSGVVDDTQVSKVTTKAGREVAGITTESKG